MKSALTKKDLTKLEDFAKLATTRFKLSFIKEGGELPSADIIRDLKFMQVFAIPATTTKDSSGKLRNSKILSSKEKAESLKGNLAEKNSANT